MNSLARTLGLATACTTLLVVGTFTLPADAQGEVCKSDTVTVSGRAKFQASTKAKELDGGGAAMADAIANWERQVGDKFGEQWKSWSDAKGAAFRCELTGQGKAADGGVIGCTIKGRPCAVGAPRGRDAAAVGGGRRGGEKETPADRDGRDRRPDSAESADEEITSYEREMARQNQMAAERRKYEEKAWEDETRAREKSRRRYQTYE